MPIVEVLLLVERTETYIYLVADIMKPKIVTSILSSE